MKKTKIVIGAAHVMVAILLIFLVVFLFTGLSTGWFSKSKEAQATGISMEMQGLYVGPVGQPQITVTRNGSTLSHGKTLTGEDLLPGDLIEVKADFATLQDEQNPTRTIQVQFLLRTPADQTDAAGKVTRLSEVPVVLNAAQAQQMHAKAGHYYLSSQIRLTSAKLQKKTGAGYEPFRDLLVDSAEAGPHSLWLTRHKMGDGPLAAYSPDLPLGRIDENKKPVTKGNAIYHLPQQQTYQIVLQLEYVNSTEENQSPLRGNWVGKKPKKVVPSSFWREIVVHEIYEQKK